MKIKVDRKICAGHALCAAKAPDVYSLDENGYCNSNGASVPTGKEEQARFGAAYCPEKAIVLTDDNGNELR